MSATTINRRAPNLRGLRSLRKPEDVEVMNIRFGVELETKVPRTCGRAVAARAALCWHACAPTPCSGNTQ